MKKLTSVLLAAVLLIGTSAGCAYVQAQSEAAEDCYQLYYTVKDLDSAHGGDAVKAQASDVQRDENGDAVKLATALMTRLLDGPTDATLDSPFPMGTQLLSVSLKSGHATVDVTSPYGTLSGVALTLADYCIALTVTQLTGVHTVSVTVRGQELAYRDTQNFSAADVLRSSTEDVVGTVGVSLYFRSEGGALSPEKRVLDLYEGDTQVEAVVAALQKGPEDKKLSATLPAGFAVQSVWTEGDICYVNLPSSALKNIASDANLQLAIESLSRSLRSLSTVGEVSYLVDGQRADRYGGAILSVPSAQD